TPYAAVRRSAEQGCRMNSWWWKVGRYAQPQWRGLLWIGIASLAGVGVKLLVPWPLTLIVDHVLAGRALPERLQGIAALPGASSPQGLVAWLAGSSVALVLAKRLLKILQEYLEAGTGSRITFGLAADLFQRLQDRSLSFHGKQRV